VGDLKSLPFKSVQLQFILNKSKFFDVYEEILNRRQLKMIKKNFKEGPKNFQGGVSAKNYK